VRWRRSGVKLSSTEQRLSHRTPLPLALCCTAFLACGEAQTRAEAEASPFELNGTGADGCNCPEQQVEFARKPYACLCGPGGAVRCPITFDDELASRCPSGKDEIVIQVEGCGKVSLESPGSYTVSGVTFDAESRQIIGMYEHSDFGRICNASGYIFGDVLFVRNGLDIGSGCPEASYCMACGNGAYPTCAR
jgi:hypothetical protein